MLKDRTVLLSQLPNGGLSVDNLTTKALKQIRVLPSTESIEFLFNNGDVVNIPRKIQSGGGVFNYITNITAAIDGQLTATTSLGQSISLGNIYANIDFSAFTGVGFYSGNDGGQLTFKPLLPGANVRLIGKHLQLSGFEVDPNFTNYLSVTEIGAVGISANSWLVSPIASTMNNIVGATVNSNNINLPKGKYYYVGVTHQYRHGGNSGARLRMNLPTSEIIASTTCYSRVGSGNVGEPTNRLVATFEVLDETARFAFEKYSTYASVAFRSGFHQFWRLDNGR